MKKPIMHLFAKAAGALCSILLLTLSLSCSDENSDAGQPSSQQTQPPPSAALRFETYDGDFFTLQKPAGWEVMTAGRGTSHAVWIFDPEQPSRQAFLFFGIGPYYLSETQREIDNGYASMGGYTQKWSDMPVIEPHTFTNFLLHWNQITESRIGKAFMAALPRLDNLQIIESTPVPSRLGIGGKAEVIRAIFTRNGKVIEGLFTGETNQMLPFMRMPGGHIGITNSFTGVTAPKEEFDQTRAYLVQTIASLRYSTENVNQWTNEINAAGQRAIQSGKTLSESSNILDEVWKQRKASDDIIAEKRSDALLNKERYYDPNDGQVYEFPAGWYEHYNRERNAYNKKNLQPLPDNEHGLWQKVPQNGERLIFQE